MTESTPARSEANAPTSTARPMSRDLRYLRVLLRFLKRTRSHPPCTYLTVAANKWMLNDPRRWIQRVDALMFFKQLLDANIEKIAIENPIGIVSSHISKPTQIIQPYEFGHDASKNTCLWLKNLPKLIGTKYIEPKIVNNKKRWANQTEKDGSNKLPPSDNRWKFRSKTYQGIADAMANQWG